MVEPIPVLLGKLWNRLSGAGSRQQDCARFLAEAAALFAVDRTFGRTRNPIFTEFLTVVHYFPH